MYLILIHLLAAAMLLGGIVSSPQPDQPLEEAQKRKVIVVVGAPGDPDYQARFSSWADNWQAAAKQGQLELIRIDGNSNKSNSGRLRIEAELKQTQSDPLDELWLILIGHGTFDGEQAKFNLVGPDLNAAELSNWLESTAKKIVVINCASSSAPFINQLAGKDRIIVTSTKSGYQYNYSRFGEYLSETIGDGGIDLDKDKQISLLEAFVAASAKTAEFYESNSRLATEHALIEDNGDARGTPGDWFRGVRAIKTAKDGSPVDGLRANQIFFIRGQADNRLSIDDRKKRDALELQIEKLRQSKSQMIEDQYYLRLEAIMLELAKLYGSINDKADRN